MLPAAGNFASCNPRAVTLAGVSAFRAADPDGLAVGVFGWADPDTGEASNTRTHARQLLGFVLPMYNGGRSVRRTFRRSYIRPGYQVTLCRAGDFWVRFPGGASAGQSVYASLVDGEPLAGYADAAELTPWFVATDAAPGALAIISTYSKVRTT